MQVRRWSATLRLRASVLCGGACQATAVLQEAQKAHTQLRPDSNGACCGKHSGCKFRPQEW